MLKLPEFKTKKELYKFLVENKESLIAQKCAAIKYADGFAANTVVVKEPTKLNANKSNSASDQDNADLIVKVIINTTKIMDSHSDVHLNGLWNKSIKENKRIMHVQEHKSNQFDKIISSGDDLKVSVKEYNWKDLGYDAEGTTEALVFDSTIKHDRNPYMYEQYSKNYVDNHSVGMRYVKLELAINDDEWGAEKEFWDKYIGEVINRKDAEEQGYFWVVPEAKVVEGSAVPNGSNPITPTLNTKNKTELTADEIKAEAIKKWLES